MIYTIQYRDFVDIIKIRTLDDGSIEYDVVEGEKHDMLVKAPGGKLYLDGEEGTMEVSELNSFSNNLADNQSRGFTYSTTAILLITHIKLNEL